MKIITCGDVVLVVDKIAAVQFDENFAGETNVLLVYLSGISEPLRVKVEDGEKALRQICDELANRV